ncbi:MAG: cache domain-containing protein, partial [Actinomycetota bacterium]
MSSPSSIRQRVAGLSRSLGAKMLAAILALTLIPTAVVGALSVDRSSDLLVAEAKQLLKKSAKSAGDVIDRNLFERFGDVQAFAANPLAAGTPGEQAEIIDFLTETYGIYDLMLIADASGVVTAVNSVDGDGAAVSTSGLIGMDVSGTDWFQVVAGGDTPAEGTYYTDAERSPLTEQVFGDGRLVLPFTAPITVDGQIVGVWHNLASFDRIASGVIEPLLTDLADQGVQTAKVNIVNREGVLLYDPDPTRILDYRLADGLRAAELAASSEPGAFGVEIENNTRTGVEQFNAWTTTNGALGFEGYDWGVLVRQESSETLDRVDGLRNGVIVIGAVAALIAGVLGWLLVRSISRPVKEISARAR